MDLAETFEKSLSLKPKEDEPTKNDETKDPPKVVEEIEVFSTPAPAALAQLRKAIESGDYTRVEEIIWSNPRCLVTVCDSAVYLMAGPKYNACHIAARANKPDIMALILDTVSNISFLRKLYTKESDQNVQDRKNHLLDSYLNTPDPRQGNTPLHFACKLGHHRVVRVLLTFEGCDLRLRDINGKTAEECICAQSGDSGDGNMVQKIKDMFKVQLSGPTQMVQLKTRLLLTKRRSSSGSPHQSPRQS